MSSEIEGLVQFLDQGFTRAAWHGPNLLGSLRGITLKELLHRPRSGGHNAWELAVHCAYWKYAVRNRLTGGKKNSFPLPGSNMFSRDEGMGLRDWQKDLALLKRQHEALKKAVQTLAPQALDKRVAGSKNTARRLVLGVVAHDVYHAGQISLLKRMQRSGERARG